MDLSKLPEAQRQELEQLQKQFQEHQAQQQKQQQESAAAAAAAAAVQQQPLAYDLSQVQQSYDPSQAYDQSYYYNYNYQDPSQQQQQYDASYYQNYYPNAYQQQHQYTHPETLVATAVPSEQQQNAGSVSQSLGPGQGQDPYVHPGNQVNLGGTQGYPVPPGLNAAAAAAVAALSQLTQFAGTMGAAERASGGAYGPPPPMVSGGHFGQGHFRPPAGDHPPAYRVGGRRGGGPFRGGGRGFRPPNTSGYGPPPFHGSGRGRGRGRGGRHDLPLPPPSSHPVEGANAKVSGGEAPSLKIAWCELCRVDCTSKEILETHKSGKRHQKNLQRLQEMKGTYEPINVEQTEKVETKENEGATKVDDEREKKPGGLKRKVKGVSGRGGKRQRQQQGVVKPKVVIPLMCDLCNVKCDTQEVFERHVGGKKHVAKLKRFQGHQAMYGPTAVQALYPPNPLSQAQSQSQSQAQSQSQSQAQTSVGAPASDQIQMNSYVAPQNPNPQLADAPLQFATPNANANVTEESPQPAGLQ